MRDRKRKRVVATAFVALHFVDVSPALTGTQVKESVTATTTCQTLYSGSVAPDIKMMSPATTPPDAFVPVPPMSVSGRFLNMVSRGGEPTCTVVSGRFTRMTVAPLCTVTVSLLRDTRRGASTALVSVALAVGRPPCGAALPTTERATITAVSTVPAADVPATGAAPGIPGGTSESRNGGPVEPGAVNASR